MKKESNFAVDYMYFAAILIFVIIREKLCVKNSDKAPKIVWEEIISSNGETYKVLFARISALHDAESILYRYCADLQFYIWNMDKNEYEEKPRRCAVLFVN